MAADSWPSFVPEGYEVSRTLGSGKTSHVYLAHHPQWGEVALKLPRQESQDSPVLRRMFENEVQITLSLDHSNIVKAYGGFPTGNRAFLALEYCSGGTLDQWILERGRGSLKDSTQLIIDVGRGLEHCHARRVLHRDVKPANVFLTAERQAKLGDFGTGIFTSEDSQERVGTAFYMAPEIFEGAQATVQSDIYSLGILAYELITGSRPFSGNDYETLMVAHLREVPKSLLHYRPEVSKTLAKVVAKAMSRAADKRYQQVADFLEEFSSAAGLVPEPAEEIIVGRASRTKPSDDRQGRGAGEVSPAADRGTRRRGVFGWLKRKKDGDE